MLRRIWDVTLTVGELERSVAFYRDVLGLDLKYAFADYAGLDCGGVEVGLRTWGEREEPRKGEPCINFLVDDVDAAHRQLMAAGVDILEGPKGTPWGGRVLLVQDPDGHAIQLTQLDWDAYLRACAPR